MKTANVKWFKDLSQEDKIKYKNKYPWMTDEDLLYFCPVCGLYEEEADFLHEEGYYVRTVTYKCKCGNKFESVK